MDVGSLHAPLGMEFRTLLIMHILPAILSILHFHEEGLSRNLLLTTFQVKICPGSAPKGIPDKKK
jgi:hypothetical protein